MEEPSQPAHVPERGPAVDSPDRFGTPAFYAAIGRAFVAMCALVPILAVVELGDRLTGGLFLRVGGIRPRRLDGLDGIILAPFLHASWDHLVVNSAPLILLGTFVLAAGWRSFLLSTLIIAVISGIGTWLLTPENTIVVGASGVVFGYLGLLLARGVVERSLWHVAVGALVAVLYGWQILLIDPANTQVSWQAHLFGFVGGLVAALLVRTRRSLPPAISHP
ncbi:rhomboid family intramembrane serine protease [Luedemannella helvata]|uniref:rhomboid family intramembrane serine protease n=1 Tax=Luedemannella helvata TaxID=349315 RepID=UPI0031E3CCE6